MEKLQRSYRAFISYSQKDKRFAKRLHKVLESYKLPTGIDVQASATKRRLGRFFRDEDEMGASTDLGQALRDAIEDSEYLIVICSPQSAQSKWVNEEILHFKRTGRENKIFAVIIDGEPNVSSTEAAVKECFPPALRYQLGKDGQITDLSTEPLGLDIRKESLLRLKVRLAASLLNIPFDTLWQRERRRKQKQTAIAFGAIASILIGFGLLGRFWWLEREKVIEKEFERVLTLATSDIAEKRELQGLVRLKPYLTGNFSKRAKSVSQKPLLWMTSIREQLETITLPGLIHFRGNFIYISNDKRFHDLSDLGTSVKRVLSSHDKKRLIVIGDYKTIVLNQTTGERLSEIQNSRMLWDSLAFERPNGLLVVFGTYYGSTNGSTSHQALIVSPDGKQVSTTYLSPIISFTRFWIAPECTDFIVEKDDENTEFKYSGGKLKQSTTKLQTPGASYIQIMGEKDDKSINTRNSDNPFIPSANKPAGQRSLINAGCRPVDLDSIQESKTSKALLPVQLNIYKNNYGVSRQLDINRIPLAYRTVTNPKLEKHYYGELGAYNLLRGQHLWRTPPSPVGTAADSTDFDAYDGTRLAFYEDSANAGITWWFCHLDGHKPNCNRTSVLHNELRPYDVVRSPDGRYVLLAQAGLIYDLKKLQPSSETLEIPTGAGSAFDFEADGTGLSVASQGKLIFFRPRKDGKWLRDQQILTVPLPKRSESPETMLYAGLMALGNGSYILAYVDGTVLRINRKGQIEWQINATDLGQIKLLRYSEDRNRFVLVGSKGYRAFRTKNRLPVSGVLSWPSQHEDRQVSSSVDEWLHNFHVSNNGSIRFILWSGSRGEKPLAVKWEPKPFTGNIPARVERLLCGNNARSTVEMLRSCYK